MYRYFREQASSGLLKAGYEYLNIDDWCVSIYLHSLVVFFLSSFANTTHNSRAHIRTRTRSWMAKQRSPTGQLIEDTTRFPSGMKALGDYIHSKGLNYVRVVFVVCVCVCDVVACLFVCL